MTRKQPSQIVVPALLANLRQSAGVSPPCGATTGLPYGTPRNVGRFGRRPQTIG